MKKIEEFFNLPATDDSDSETLPVPKTKDELLAEAKELTTAISTAEKVDYALPMVTGLDTHDSEMDEIAKKAVDTFNDLINLGGNVPDMHAGKIYEVAGQMLKTALDAKNAKAEKKLRMIELQLKKVRAEQIDLEQGNIPRGQTSGEFDRNELLKWIVSSKDGTAEQ